jgi:hypothetical protein
MRPVIRFTTLLTLGLVACGSGSDLAPVPNPPDDFAFAYASPSCAPWDGRAVEILLTEAPSADPEQVRPQLRVAIYPRTSELEGTTYRWPADQEMATGARCEADSCQTAPAGEVRLSAVRPDSTLEGTVSLRFGPGDVLTGGFRATWRSRRMLCG